MIKPQSNRSFLVTAGSPTSSACRQIDLPELQEDLNRAVAERWKIAPVDSHSRFASLWQFGTPSRDPSDITLWASQFPDSNWCVETGRASALVILEVDNQFGRDSLRALCNEDWGGWTRTLQFRDGVSSHLLFRYAGERVRFLPSRFKGLKIHAGSCVVIPPSWFVGGSPLAYSDPHAKLVDCPEFLLELGQLQRVSAKVIPFHTDKRPRPL